MSRVVAVSLRGYRILSPIARMASLRPTATTTAAPLPIPAVVGRLSAAMNAASDVPSTNTNAASSASAAVDMNTMCVYSNAKAGMNGSDKEHINRVIYENSKDSAHFKNQQRKADKVALKIAAMKKRVESLKAQSRNTDGAMRRLSSQIAEMEARRDVTRTWIHVDMDMFYAAVEIRDNPSLANKPVAVGSMSMISTSNYEARKYGVRAAMPGFIAMKLCPHLIFVKHNFMKYKEVAEQARAVFRDYDPEFEAGSLDEAYLDVTDYINRHNTAAVAYHDAPAAAGQPHHTNGDESPDITELLTPPAPPTSSTTSSSSSSSATVKPTKGHAGGGGSGRMIGPQDIIDGRMVASEIRARIFAATRLTASAGVACNRMLSKICSDMNKPNGQFTLPSRAADILAFMDNLSVRKVPGIGSVMERTLKELGITTCRDIRHGDMALYLNDILSNRSCEWLVRASLGLSESVREPPDENALQKSMSCDRTFREISHPIDLENKCREIAKSLAEDLGEANVEGRHLTLKLKNTDFETLQRSTMLPRYIHTHDDIVHFALIVLHDEIQKHARKTVTMDNFLKTATPVAGITAIQPTVTLPPSPVKPTVTTTNTSSAAVAAKKASDLKHNFSGKKLRLRLMGLRLASLRFRDTAPGNANALNTNAPARTMTTTAALTTTTASSSSTGRESRRPHHNERDDEDEIPDSGDDCDNDEPMMRTRRHHDTKLISASSDNDDSSWESVVDDTIPTPTSTATTPSVSSLPASSIAAPSGSKYARQNGQYNQGGASSTARAVNGPANTIGHAGNNWTKREPSLRVRPPSPLTAMIHAMNSTTSASSSSSVTTAAPFPAESSLSSSPSATPTLVAPVAVLTPVRPAVAKAATASTKPSSTPSASRDITDLTLTQASPVMEHKRSSIINDAISSSSSSSMWQCPICGAPVPRDNRELNQHVDQCLGGKGSDNGNESAAVIKRTLQLGSGVTTASSSHGIKRKTAGGKSGGTMSGNKSKNKSSAKSKSKSKSKKTKSASSSSSSSASSSSTIPIGSFFR